jgi:hypothetical protein
MTLGREDFEDLIQIGAFLSMIFALIVIRFWPRKVKG